MNKLSEDYLQRFGGIGRLYGRNALNRFAASSVMVIGLGGVGSWAVEAIARSGIGRIILVDLDDVCLTNVNRQIQATTETVGRSKVSALKERIGGIAPACRVEGIETFFNPLTAESILEAKPDFILDAMDDVRAKALLVDLCRENQLRCAVSGSVGGRKDLDRIFQKDLTQTVNDRLLAKLRKILRTEYGFPRETRRRFKVPAVYSDELPVFPGENGEVCSEPAPEGKALIGCDAGLGAATHLSGTFGFTLAGIALKEIAAKKA